MELKQTTGRQTRGNQAAPSTMPDASDKNSVNGRLAKRGPSPVNVRGSKNNTEKEERLQPPIHPSGSRGDYDPCGSSRQDVVDLKLDVEYKPSVNVCESLSEKNPKLSGKDVGTPGSCFRPTPFDGGSSGSAGFGDASATSSRGSRSHLPAGQAGGNLIGRQGISDVSEGLQSLDLQEQPTHSRSRGEHHTGGNPLTATGAPSQRVIDLKLEEQRKQMETSGKSLSTEPSELSEDDKFLLDVRVLLNKLTPQNVSALTQNLLDLSFYQTKQRLKCVVDLICEKALDKRHDAVTYAQLCTTIVHVEAPSHPPAGFRDALVQRAKKSFDETDKASSKAMQKFTDVRGPKAKEAAEKKAQAAKDRYLGSTRFITELYEKQVLTGEDILSCYNKRLHYKAHTLPLHDEEKKLVSLAKRLMSANEQAGLGSERETPRKITLRNIAQGTVSLSPSALNANIGIRFADLVEAYKSVKMVTIPNNLFVIPDLEKITVASIRYFAQSKILIRPVFDEMVEIKLDGTQSPNQFMLDPDLMREIILKNEYYNEWKLHVYEDEEKALMHFFRYNKTKKTIVQSLVILRTELQGAEILFANVFDETRWLSSKVAKALPGGRERPIIESADDVRHLLTVLCPITRRSEGQNPQK